MSNPSNEPTAARPAPYAQIRIREPAGERVFGERLTIGGEGAEVVVPGVDGVAVVLERRDAQWFAVPQSRSATRFNGRPLGAPRDLRRHDALSLGEAQLGVAEVSRTLLRMEVHHLVGNATIAPLGEVAALAVDEGDEELEIRASTPLTVASPTAATESVDRDAVAPSGRGAQPPSQSRVVMAISAVVLAVLLFLAFSMEPIALDVIPEDARVSAPGSWAAVRVGGNLFVLPGERVVRAEREGYEPSQVRVDVESSGDATARLRLGKLPGRLDIDTGGVPVSVSVDGAEAGRAPGEVAVPAGRHTITLKSARHLDHVATLEIEGAGARQALAAAMRPSWGTLAITAVPASAQVIIDGRQSGTVPVTLELDSGVRRVQLDAPGFKSWQSSVVIKAGETLALGPITMGQPDARLSVRSQPSGADISIGGTLRGRTPLVVDLPPGISHEVVATLPGFASWMRSVRAEPGKSISLEARLEAASARVSVRGEPAGAELLVDGVSRGQTPQSLELSEVEHRLEVRKEGFVPFTTAVTPAKGLEREIEYRLTSADRATALLDSAPTIRTRSGYALVLIPGGTFAMGSDRREQGRRPNEPLRKVTLRRPFYLGVTEVTNAEYHRFRSAHASGYIGQQSLDLDQQAVSKVDWEDAAEYCNWLSESEGLPPAYEKRDVKYFLKKPAGLGYRLPTEAEWEYAARRAGPDRMLRYPWGDALPVPEGAGNLAGAEAQKIVEGDLPGYRDDYLVVAPVGKFRETALGLHDLGGNVSEWVNDYYLYFVDTTPTTDPLGPEQAGRHVIRGANWRTISASELRLAWRDSADEGSQTIGFRIARYAD